MKRTVATTFLILLAALFAGVGPDAAPLQEPNTPLDLPLVELALKRVAKLPKGDIPYAQAEVAKIIRRRGAGFRLNAQNEESLRGLGASPEVIRALRVSYRDGGAGDYTAREAAGVKAAPAHALATAISAGVLNSRALARPQMIVPAEAEAAGAGGPVTVAVLVDEDGSVVRAEAVGGSPLLRKAAEGAALRTKIRPLTLNGQAVVATGVLLVRP